MTEDREIVIIQRRSSDDVALIAADELAGLLETVHLLHSPTNAERLLNALTRVRQRDAVFQAESRGDLRYWVETDRCTALRDLALIEAILRDPFAGIGKPEPLNYFGAGVWSRRRVIASNS